jgi:hypothetical protein
MANSKKSSRKWSTDDDSLIIEAVTKNGLNRKTFTALKQRFDVSRHQLRGHLNSLGLTTYGQKRKSERTTVLNPTDARILELERRVRVVNQQRGELAQKVQALQDNSSVIQALREDLREHVKPLVGLPVVPYKPVAGKVVEEDLVMHLSDEHADQVVKPHRVLGLEDYNLRVALARGERYVQTTLEFTRQTLSNYRFKRLWILNYGDHSNGELHSGLKHSEYQNIFRNVLAIGQMHALMYRDLAPHFDEIQVICVPGNHGRRTPKKDYHGAWDNWDYLVAETSRLLLKDHKNVHFTIPDAFSVNVNIAGYIFNISHGDDVQSWNSIPYYGIERKTRRLSSLQMLAAQPIHYFVMGHFHALSSMPSPGGRTIINGSWKLTDEYLLGKLGAANPPEQLIHGVHPDHGITWSLNVNLKFPGDADGPKRYAIDLAAPY